jgi:hypothetical protein
MTPMTTENIDTLILGYKGITTKEQFEALKDSNPEAYAKFKELHGEWNDAPFFYAPYIPLYRNATVQPKPLAENFAVYVLAFLFTMCVVCSVFRISLEIATRYSQYPIVAVLSGAGGVIISILILLTVLTRIHLNRWNPFYIFTKRFINLK